MWLLHKLVLLEIVSIIQTTKARLSKGIVISTLYITNLQSDL